MTVQERPPGTAEPPAAGPARRGFAASAGGAILRSLLAVAVAAAVGALLWTRAPTAISGFPDVVGYPTLVNFNFERMSYAFLLAVFVLPAVTLAVLVALGRWGPLAYTPARERPLRRSVDAVTGSDPAAAVDAADERAGGAGKAPVQAAGTGGWWATAMRTLLTAVVVAVAFSTGGEGIRHGLTSVGVVVAAVYLVLVAAAAGVLLLMARRGRAPAGRTAGEAAALAAAALSGLAVLAGLFYVSSETKVIRPDGTDHWPWISVPALLIAVAVFALVLVVRSRGRSWRLLESEVFVYLTGSVFVFSGLSIIPSALGSFQGFDDSHGLTGALLLTEGYLPWRDFLFIHGLFPDGLQSLLGFELFEPSRWGSAAGGAVIVTPLAWTLMYVLAAWASARSPWVLIPLIVALRVGGVLLPLDTRFVLVPVALLVLGQVVRGPARIAWCAGLTTLLFVQAMLVPETSLLVVAIAVVLLVSDWVSREPGASWRRRFANTLTFVVSGAVLVAGTAAVLALAGMLTAVVQYYLIVGPGHSASGALPVTEIGVRDGQASYYFFIFGLSVALPLLVLWYLVAKIRGRRALTAVDWVTAATAANCALYAQKAVARLDGDHVIQGFSATLPVALLMLSILVNGCRGLLRRRAAVGYRFAIAAQPVVALVVVAVVALMPSARGRVTLVADRMTAVVTGAILDERLGYSSPTAVDPAMLRDLDTAVSHFSPAGEPVFDMTNSLGYYYFLLGRQPASRFIHVSLAVTEYAQELLIEDLEQTQPALIVADARTIGLPFWDDVPNDIRHFEVSQYVLDHWRPVAVVHGVTLMLRNDLPEPAEPLPVGTTGPTLDMYFGGPSCDWGYAANYLESTPVAPTVSLVPGAPTEQTFVSVGGWVLGGDAAATTDWSTVVVAQQGRELDTRRGPPLNRPDVAKLYGPEFLSTGFLLGAVALDDSRPTVYLQDAGGVLHPVPDGGATGPPAATVLRTDGTTSPVGAAAVGNIDTADVRPVLVRTLELPASAAWSDYALLTVQADATLGDQRITVNDMPSLPDRVVAFDTLDRSGSQLSVRAGSCLQWHGFGSRTLYLTQTGGPPVTAVELSGVSD